MRLKLALQVAERVTFGATTPIINAVRQNDRFYALAINEYGKPQVFDYEESDDGREGLMNLLRADEVVTVIFGQKLDFKLASVAHITVNGQAYESVLPIGRT